MSYLEWQIDHDLQNPTKRNLAWVARATETLEELKQKLKRGTRGPPQRGLRNDPDSEYFPEISRLMEMYGSKPHRAAELVVRELVSNGRLSTDKTKEESHVQRIYRKFLQQR